MSNHHIVNDITQLNPVRVIAIVALSAFLWIELTAAKPLLNLRLLFRRNFGFGQRMACKLQIRNWLGGTFAMHIGRSAQGNGGNAGARWHLAHVGQHAVKRAVSA